MTETEKLEMITGKDFEYCYYADYDDYRKHVLDGVFRDESEEELAAAQKIRHTCSSLEQIQEEFKDDTFGLRSRMDASQGWNGELDREFPDLHRGETVVSFERRFADKALKFYEQRMHEEFEVVQVLFSSRAIIAVPGFGLDRVWCHVSFTAIPKNTECIDDSEKCFFGEMVFNLAEDDYDVIFCSTFNPSDPGLHGCVFCPSHEIFAHPANGCPAGGREKNDKLTGGIQMDASQGQIVRCSSLHPERLSFVFDDPKEIEKHFERVKLINQGYAELALKIYKEEMGVEYEIVELLSTESEALVGPESVLEEWCHVCFTAKPKKIDSSCVSPDYFLGELLRDNSTKKFKAKYCNIFNPNDDSESKHRTCSDISEECASRNYGCAICPCQIHPSHGSHVDITQYNALKYPHFVTDGPNI